MPFNPTPRVTAGRLVGRVGSWKPEGGYGFVRVGRIAYFVHLSAVDDGSPLAPGEGVEFTPTLGPRGPRATLIRRLRRCPKCEEDLRGLTCGACGFRLDEGTA